MPYKLTSAAAEDLISISAYGIEQFGPAKALAYQRSLEHTFDLIAFMPGMGRKDQDHPGYRKFPHGRHIIFYRVDGETVVIARLLHSAMDLPRHDVSG